MSLDASYPTGVAPNEVARMFRVSPVLAFAAREVFLPLREPLVPQRSCQGVIRIIGEGRETWQTD